MPYRLSHIRRWHQMLTSSNYLNIYILKALLICNTIILLRKLLPNHDNCYLLLLLVANLIKKYYFVTKSPLFHFCDYFWSRTIPMHIVFHRASSLSPSVLLQSSLNYQIKSQTLKFTHRYLFKEWQKYDPGKSPLKQRIFRREYLDTLSWRIQSVCACLSVCVWEFVCDYVFCYTTIELSVWMIPMK